MKNTPKNHLPLALKGATALALLGILFYNSDLEGLKQQFLSIHPLAITSAFALMLLSVSISAWKWKILLSIHGAEYSFSFLHKVYFIAVFFNNFLPTSIGGDGYRIIKTINNKKSKSCAIIAVLMERLTGIAALLLIGYMSAITLYLKTGDYLAGLIARFGTITILILLGFALLLARTNLLRYEKLAPSKILMILREHFGDYKIHLSKTAKVAWISIFFQLHNSVAFYILLTIGLNTDIRYDELFIVLTIMNIIAILPISINGIGVTEGSFVYLTGLYGIDYEASLTVIVIIRALVLAISLIGAAYYIIDGANQQKLENNTENM